MSNLIKTKIRKNGRKYSIRINRDRIFLPSEWILFYNNLKSDKQKFTFLFLINTGARINEVRNVKVSDIDFKQKILLLRKVKGGNSFSDGKLRKIPISKSFCKQIKKQIKNDNLLGDDFLPILSTPAANIAMKISMKKSGLVDWKMMSVHSVRKTLESWLVCLDVNSLKLLLHMGHSQSVALKYYIKLITDNPIEKYQIRKIIGNLYSGNGEIDELKDRIKKLEELISETKNQTII